MAKDQKLADVFQERTVLYTRYADLTIDCTGMNSEATVQSIYLQLHISH